MSAPTRHRCLTALLAAAMLGAAMLGGCGDKDTPATGQPDGSAGPPTGQRTPPHGSTGLSPDAQAARAAALAFLQAQTDGNGQALADLTDVPPGAKEYVAALAPTAGTMHRFHQAGAKAYGRAAWLAAQPAGSETIPPLLADARASGRTRLTDTGAEFAVPDSETLVLVKRDGRWLVRPPMRVPDSPEDRQALLTNHQRVATVLRGVMPLIGKDGTKAGDIMDTALHAVRAALIEGAPPAPARSTVSVPKDR